MPAMTVPDWILVALLVIATAVGAFSGLVRMLFRLASIVVSFVVFLFLAPPIAAAIQGFSVFDGARDAIREFLLKQAGAVSTGTVSDAIAGLGLPERLRSLLDAGFPDPAASLSAQVEPLSSALFQFALTAVVGVVLFLLVMIVFWIARTAIEAGLHRVKALDGANHFLGAVLGLAEGLLLVFVALGFLALATTWVPGIAHFVEEEALLLGWLYDRNPLLLLLR